MRPMRCSKLRACAVALLCMLAFGSTGCARSTLRAGEAPASRPVEGIGRGFFEPRVEAFVVPPKEWTMDAPKITDRHAHLAWISPTGDTAYGVIYARIPSYVPVAVMPAEVGHSQVVGRVMVEVRADEGEATLLGKSWDEDADELHFVAEGGLYRVDSVLTVRGLSAWTLYVGRLREREENPAEVELAE